MTPRPVCCLAVMKVGGERGARMTAAQCIKPDVLERYFVDRAGAKSICFEERLSTCAAAGR